MIDDHESPVTSDFVAWARGFPDLLPDPDDLVDEKRRTVTGEVLRAVAYNATAYVVGGRLKVRGSRESEFAERLEPFNRIDERFGKSIACHKFESLFFGEVQ